MLDFRPKTLFYCTAKGNFPIKEASVKKTELVQAISEKAGLSRKDAEQAVGAFVETIIDQVKKGDKITLVGFGTFAPSSRAARTGRHPQTGAPLQIPAAKTVRFSMGSTFKTALNSDGGGSEAKKNGSIKKVAAAKGSSSSGKTTSKQATVAKSSTKSSSASAKKSSAKPSAKKAPTNKKK